MREYQAVSHVLDVPFYATVRAWPSPPAFMNDLSNELRGLAKLEVTLPPGGSIPEGFMSMWLEEYAGKGQGWNDSDWIYAGGVVDMSNPTPKQTQCEFIWAGCVGSDQDVGPLIASIDPVPFRHRAISHARVALAGSIPKRGNQLSRHRAPNS